VRESSDGGVLIHSHIRYITSMLIPMNSLFLSPACGNNQRTDSFWAEIAGPQAQILLVLRFLRQHRTKDVFCLHVSNCSHAYESIIL
jgi:hypothetical protein